MSFKNNLMRGLALYGASSMTTSPAAGKVIASALHDLENDAR